MIRLTSVSCGSCGSCGSRDLVIRSGRIVCRDCGWFPQEVRAL